MKIASKSTLAIAVAFTALSCNSKSSRPSDSSPAAQPAATAQPTTNSSALPALIQEVDSESRVAVSHQQVLYQPGQAFDIGDGKTVDPAGAKLEPTPLERDLLGKMKAVNPRMNGIDVVAAMPVWSLEERAHYLVMAYTTSPDAPFNDKFTNLAHAADMFGVFVVNREFTRAERRIGLFVSPRSGDFGAFFGRTTSDSVVVCGRGGTYGDSQSRWVFAISPSVSAKRRAEDAALAVAVKALRDSIARDSSNNVHAQDEDDGDGVPWTPTPDCPWSKPKS
jgi:hypothetical protein